MTDELTEKAIHIIETWTGGDDALGLVPAIASALREERERAAKIADVWTVRVVPRGESIIADSIANTARDIATAIRGDQT